MSNNAKSIYDDAEEMIKARIIDENKNSFPPDVVLETTTFCNLNCIMCTRDKLTRDKTKMRWPLYIKLIEEIAAKAKDTTRLWLCFFGEPLMDKQFTDRVILAKQKGIKNVVINSNMNLMTEERSKELVKAGLNTVFVGFDAATADTYHKIRRGGNFEKTVKNILFYKKMLEQYGQEDQQIVVQFVELPENINEKEKAIEFWNSNGIRVKVRPIVTWQGAIGYKNSSEVRNRVACHWIMNILPISADGYAAFCGCDYDAQGKCADLNKNTIEEVWNTVKKEQRRIQLAGEWARLPVFCRNCEDWQGGYATYE